MISLAKASKCNKTQCSIRLSVSMVCFKVDDFCVYSTIWLLTVNLQK